MSRFESLPNINVATSVPPPENLKINLHADGEESDLPNLLHARVNGKKFSKQTKK